jgi:DNA (cytosine-5)-methyltransferase 1
VYHTYNEPIKNDMAHKPLNTFHLFAGAGGGILGDLLLGHNPIGACEIEQYPRDVLLARQRDGHLPNFPIWDDVCTLDGNPWRGSVDVLCGGFPCQDISAAGKGAGITGERSGLWKEYARLIGEMRPRFVFAENSPLLRTRGLGVVLEDLAALGYNARWGVLGAGAVGAPHKRDRMWVLAYAKGERYGKRGESGDILKEDGRPNQPMRPELTCTGENASHLAYTKCEQGDSERRSGQLRRNTVGRKEQTTFSKDGQASSDCIDGQGKTYDLAYTNNDGNATTEESEGTTQGSDSGQTWKEPTSEFAGLCASRTNGVVEGLPANAADTTGEGLEGFNEHRSTESNERPRQGNTGSKDCNAFWHTDPAELPNANDQWNGRGEQQPTSRKEAKQPCGTGNEERTPEPVVGRVAHGVPNRVDRLKAIGNGQVPQCAAVAFNILSKGLITPTI